MSDKNFIEIKNWFQNLTSHHDLFKDLSEIADKINAECEIINPGSSPLMYFPEGHRLNLDTQKIERISSKEPNRTDIVIHPRIEEKVAELLKRIKDYAAEKNTMKDFLLSIDWLTEIINKLYFLQPHPDYKTPACLTYFGDDESPIVVNRRLMKLDFECVHYGVYESPEGERFMFRDSSFYWDKSHVAKPEPLMNLINFKFIESISFIFEVIRPLHALESHPKNIDDVLKESSIFSMERYKTPLEVIFHNPLNNKSIPDKVIVPGAMSWIRRHPGEEWRKYCQGRTPTQEQTIDIGEFESLEKDVYKLYIEPFVNPMDKGEEHLTSIKIGGGEDDTPAYTVVVHLKGDAVKNEKRVQEQEEDRKAYRESR